MRHVMLSERRTAAAAMERFVMKSPVREFFWLLCGSTSRLLVSPCPWPMAAFSYATAAHSSATSMGTSCSCPSTFACGFASTTHEQSLVHFHRLALFEECSTTNNIN